MNKPAYRLSFGLLLRRFVETRTISILFGAAGPIIRTGVEYVPRGTAYIVAANHVSIFDPPLLITTWPEMLEVIGADDVFEKPVQGEILKFYGTIRVHRGEYDRVVIDTMLTILRAGRPLMIAPEGTRSHVPGMRLAKPGIAYVVDEAQVPVLPVGIVGTTDDYLSKAIRLQRPRLELRIGKPFRLPPIEGRGEARREARQRNADLVMQHIAGLLPPEYRGVYADSAIAPT